MDGRSVENDGYRCCGYHLSVDAVILYSHCLFAVAAAVAVAVVGVAVCVAAAVAVAVAVSVTVSVAVAVAVFRCKNRNLAENKGEAKVDRTVRMQGRGGVTYGKSGTKGGSSITYPKGRERVDKNRLKDDRKSAKSAGGRSTTCKESVFVGGQSNSR